MHCSCSQRAAANEWMQNHNKYPSSRESLTSRKSNLKTPSKPGSSSSLNRQSRNRQEQQRSATLPRSSSNPRHRKTPNVSTIFNDSITSSHVNLHQQTNSSYYRQRRKSDMAPWQRKSADAALKCTCRNSCYFCELNYPKVINNNLSTSTNALSFSNHPPPATSSYSINNLNYVQHQNIPTNNSSLNLHQYSFPNNNLVPNYQHHHSMINLNHIGANNNTKATEMAEDSPPIPAPPIPPLNPSCARCRFTANSSSNPTINCSQNGVGCGLSNQNSVPGFTASAVVAPVATMSDNVVANCFAGEFHDWIIACTKFFRVGRPSVENLSRWKLIFRNLLGVFIATLKISSKPKSQQWNIFEY